MAIAVAGWQLGTDPALDVGVFGLPGATAEPTGPPGPTGGGMTDGGGSQFQPPQIPNQMPDYQSGNQPPLDQSNGISIYNTGSPGAQQVPSQQGAQQAPQQAQQPAHGTQIPDYQTAAPYTQGPGQANPDYQAPQQQQPEQGHEQFSQQQQAQQTQVPQQTAQPTQPPKQAQPNPEPKQQQPAKPPSQQPPPKGEISKPAQVQPSDNAGCA
ncbi:hypothetical protein D2E80_15780 [Mycobacteroides abscessus]|nr:hypothetical protein D2E80_15780 [Mycobacteroides abscessus]